MKLQIACNLFTQRPKQEKDDFVRWAKMTLPGAGGDFLRMNGAGETLNESDGRSYAPYPVMAPSVDLLLVGGVFLDQVATALPLRRSTSRYSSFTQKFSETVQHAVDSMIASSLNAA